MSIDYEQKAEFTRELAVELNDHELKLYGGMLAEKVREEELAIEKKAQQNKEHNARIQTIRNEIKRIADARAKGEELRPVRCSERLKGNVIEIVRLDLQTVVDTRPADLRDLQTSFPESGDHAPGSYGGGVGVDIDEGPREMGRVLQLVPDSDAPYIEPGAGEVRDDEGTYVGETVESSTGAQVYVGSESMCATCSLPIIDSDQASEVAGELVHVACLPEDLIGDAKSFDTSDSPLDGADVPGLTTIAEQQEAKKRPRSKKKNEATKPKAKK